MGFVALAAGGRRRHGGTLAMAEGTRSTVMFVVGVAMALGAGGLMFFTGPLTVIGTIGATFTAVGGARVLDR